MPECKDNCQLLRTVHQFGRYNRVLHPRIVARRKVALHLTSYNNSQLRSHSVFHWKALRNAPSTVIYPTIATLPFIRVSCGFDSIFYGGDGFIIILKNMENSLEAKLLKPKWAVFICLLYWQNTEIHYNMRNWFCACLYIEGDSGGICYTLGNDSMCDSKQKSSYEHGTDFEWLSRYGKKKIRAILRARIAIT